MRAVDRVAPVGAAAAATRELCGCAADGARESRPVSDRGTSAPGGRTIYWRSRFSVTASMTFVSNVGGRGGTGAFLTSWRRRRDCGISHAARARYVSGARVSRCSASASCARSRNCGRREWVGCRRVQGLRRRGREEGRPRLRVVLAAPYDARPLREEDEQRDHRQQQPERGSRVDVDPHRRPAGEVRLEILIPLRRGEGGGSACRARRSRGHATRLGVGAAGTPCASRRTCIDGRDAGKRQIHHRTIEPMMHRLFHHVCSHIHR